MIGGVRDHLLHKLACISVSRDLMILKLNLMVFQLAAINVVELCLCTVSLR